MINGFLGGRGAKHPNPSPETSPMIKVKVAHTRLPSVVYWSWSRFLAVSLQVTWVINPVGGWLPLLSARATVILATLKKAATNFAAWWTEARWCDITSGSVVLQSVLGDDGCRNTSGRPIALANMLANRNFSLHIISTLANMKWTRTQAEKMHTLWSADSQEN